MTPLLVVASISSCKSICPKSGPYITDCVYPWSRPRYVDRIKRLFYSVGGSDPRSKKMKGLWTKTYSADKTPSLFMYLYYVQYCTDVQSLFWLAMFCPTPIKENITDTGRANPTHSSGFRSRSPHSPLLNFRSCPTCWLSA